MIPNHLTSDAAGSLRSPLANGFSRRSAMGPTAYPVEQAVVDKNAALFVNPDRQELRSTTLVWPALLRKVDRLDPSYKN